MDEKTVGIAVNRNGQARPGIKKQERDHPGKEIRDAALHRCAPRASIIGMLAAVVNEYDSGNLTVFRES